MRSIGTVLGRARAFDTSHPYPQNGRTALKNHLDPFVQESAQCLLRAERQGTGADRVLPGRRERRTVSECTGRGSGCD